MSYSLYSVLGFLCFCGVLVLLWLVHPLLTVLFLVLIFVVGALLQRRVLNRMVEP